MDSTWHLDYLAEDNYIVVAEDSCIDVHVEEAAHVQAVDNYISVEVDNCNVDYSVEQQLSWQQSMLALPDQHSQVARNFSVVVPSSKVGYVSYSISLVKM